MARISFALALPALGLAAITVSAQNVPQPPTVSVSTRLVQVGVIVRNKDGTVANLTRDDFVVLDRGKPQNISVFSVESSEAPAQPSQPLPQNTFSDLPQYGTSKPRSVTIVLLDNLNTLSGSTPQPYENNSVTGLRTTRWRLRNSDLTDFLKQIGSERPNRHIWPHRFGACALRFYMRPRSAVGSLEQIRPHIQRLNAKQLNRANSICQTSLIPNLTIRSMRTCSA